MLKVRVEIVPFFLLLISHCFAANCRTCRGNECETENVQIKPCNGLSSLLPLGTYALLSKTKDNLQYGCLKLEYPNGGSSETIEKCIISDNINNFCANIAKTVAYTYCTVNQPLELYYVQAFEENIDLQPDNFETDLTTTQSEENGLDITTYLSYSESETEESGTVDDAVSTDDTISTTIIYLNNNITNPLESTIENSEESVTEYNEGLSTITSTVNHDEVATDYKNNITGAFEELIPSTSNAVSSTDVPPNIFDFDANVNTENPDKLPLISESAYETTETDSVIVPENPVDLDDIIDSNSSERIQVSLITCIILAIIYRII